MTSKSYFSFFLFGPSVFRPTMSSADSSEVTKSPYDDSCLLQDTPEASLGKSNNLPCKLPDIHYSLLMDMDFVGGGTLVQTVLPRI